MSISIETRNAINELVMIMKPLLNEKQRRILFGAAANVLGRGGVTAIHEDSGASRVTITVGQNEAKQISSNINKNDFSKQRIRKEGAGRKKEKDKNPELYKTIETIIRDSTYGSPMTVLTWTTLSLRKIADILQSDYGITVSHNIISRALDDLGYSKQQNQKNLQVGKPHPDRDSQFKFINDKAKEFIENNDPVISVDTKKKELVGNFKNSGSEYRKKKDPRQVLDHDFALQELDKVAPYGVYVLNDNTGFVNLVLISKLFA